MASQAPTKKVAIVTGGGYGIGRGITKRLAAHGWSVVIYDVNEPRARETQEMVQDTGGDCWVIEGDVTNWSQVQGAVGWTMAKYGKLDGLVNNAAMRYVGTVLEITEEQWDRTVDVCLKGPFLLCKAVIPHMIAAGGGSIVNFSSGDAYGRRRMIPYATAKGGIITLTLCLAADHMEHHIRVNAVLPGFTVTGMTENYPPERYAEIAARSVAGRVGLPEDVAPLVHFLLSDDSATITGGVFGSRPLAQR